MRGVGLIVASRLPLPPSLVGRIDQGEAADAEILKTLMATYRATREASGHSEALVAVTVAAAVVVGLGSGERIAGALAVAVARLCEKADDA